jgi:hypothetical protein
LDFPRTERYNRMNGLDPNVVSPIQAPSLGTLHGGEIFASSSNRSPGYNLHSSTSDRVLASPIESWTRR